MVLEPTKKFRAITKRILMPIYLGFDHYLKR